MKILPFDSFEIETLISKQEATAILGSRTGCEDTDCFRGKIQQDQFKIYRIINYRNSFLPIIPGKFREGRGCVIISIQMRLNLFVLGFMAIWFSGIGCFVFITLCSKKWLALGLMMLLLLVGWALMNGCFWLRAKKNKKTSWGNIPPRMSKLKKILNLYSLLWFLGPQITYIR